MDNNFNGVPAADGDQWLDTEASPGGNDIQQELALTVGETYTLTFKVNPAGASPGTALTVFFGGSPILTINASTLTGRSMRMATRPSPLC